MNLQARSLLITANPREASAINGARADLIFERSLCRILKTLTLLAVLQSSHLPLRDDLWFSHISNGYAFLVIP